MTDVSIPGVSRQQLKAIKNMGLPELRKWLLAYSWNAYNIGVADCKDALRKEFGFGEKRLKRMTDYMESRIQESAKVQIESEGGSMNEP